MTMQLVQEEASVALNELLSLLLDVPSKEDAIKSLRDQGIAVPSHASNKLRSDPHRQASTQEKQSGTGVEYATTQNGQVTNTTLRKPSTAPGKQQASTDEVKVESLVLIEQIRSTHLRQEPSCTETVIGQECTWLLQQKGYEETLKDQRLRKAARCTYTSKIKPNGIRASAKLSPRPPNVESSRKGSLHRTMLQRNRRNIVAYSAVNKQREIKQTVFPLLPNASRRHTRYKLLMQHPHTLPKLMLYTFTQEHYSTKPMLVRQTSSLKVSASQKVSIKLVRTITPRFPMLEDHHAYMEFIKNHHLYGSTGETKHSNGPPSITNKDFAELVASELGVVDPMIARRIFTVFDFNNIGRVSLEEYVIGMSIIRCNSAQRMDIKSENGDDSERNETDCDPVTEKMKILFQMYDADKNGFIKHSEIPAMLREGYGHFWQLILFHDMVLGCTSPIAEEVLSEKRYLKVCHAIPCVKECFSNGFPFAQEYVEVVDSQTLNDATMRQLTVTSWETMQVLMTRLKAITHGYEKGTGNHKRHHGMQSLDFEAFMSLMRPFFRRSSSLDRKLCIRLFSAFDVDGDGLVSPKEFTAQLNLLFKGSPKEQAKFYFYILDLDGDKLISRAELFHVLAKRTIGIKNPSVRFSERALQLEIDQIMSNVDSDSDGTISESECIAAAQRNPGILGKFERSLFAQR